MPPKKSQITVNPSDSDQSDNTSSPSPTTQSSHSEETRDTPMADQKPKKKAKVTPKKGKVQPKDSKVWTELPTVVEPGEPIHTMPITVSYEDSTTQSKMNADGQYEHYIKLVGTQAFKLANTCLVYQGDHASYQVITVLPSKPFPLMKLPKEVRAIIWQQVLAPLGQVEGKIVISNATGGRSGVTAKTYTQNSKHRLAILLASKEILNEARPILYGFHFKFDDTAALLSFLTLTSENVRRNLGYIEVGVYKKNSAQSAFSMMADCKALRRLHIGQGVAHNATPAKAAKAFYFDSYRFLQVMGSHKNDKNAGMNILRFGKSIKCFSVKDGEEVRAWTEDEKLEFQQLMIAKLHASSFRFWSCICGTLVPHNCIDELEARKTLIANSHSSTSQAKSASRSKAKSRKRKDREECDDENDEFEHLRHGGAEMFGMLAEGEYCVED